MDDADASVLTVLAALARTQPQHPAVVDGEVRLTYAELVDRVEAGAHRLRAAGLAPHDRVAIVAESSADYLVAVLAVWRAGAVIATVYPSSGSSDLRYAIELADPVLLLTDGRADLTAVPVRELGLPVASTADLAVTEPLRVARPTPSELANRLAMICFSSGTTSRPKAIMLSTATLHNCAETYREVWRLGPSDRTVVGLPLAWLYGLASTTLATLVGGGTVVLLRRSRPELVAEAIEAEGATFLPGVTATFARLAELAQQEPDPTWHRTLRLCISGGEPRNERAFDRFWQATGIPVLDAYCASECLPLVTYDPVADEPVPGAAGRLVPRALLKVLRPDGTPVDVDEVGEAFSAGPGLMLGYWADAEATDEALTDDGWYRTRDLVKVDRDGYVHVVGRLSEVIIRGGTNVSPAEVEAVLCEHPAVAAAGVVGEPDDIYGEVVVAAVVPRSGADVDPDEVIARARERLAAYKVPGRVVVLPSLPTGPTGKLSRATLRADLTGPVPGPGGTPDGPHRETPRS